MKSKSCCLSNRKPGNIFQRTLSNSQRYADREKLPLLMQRKESNLSTEKCNWLSRTRQLLILLETEVSKPHPMTFVKEKMMLYVMEHHTDGVFFNIVMFLWNMQVLHLFTVWIICAFHQIFNLSVSPIFWYYFAAFPLIHFIYFVAFVFQIFSKPSLNYVNE